MKERRKWSEFTWPEWVPQSVRDEVQSFWSASSGRGPDEWERNGQDVYNKPPPFGARVRILLACERPDKYVVGRYVHAWNNIGRLIDDNGCVHVVCTARWLPSFEPASVGWSNYP